MSFITADKTFHQTMSTGVSELDRLLGGGFEVSLMHIFYGSGLHRDDLLRFAVQYRFPDEEGGFNGSCTVIDSNYILSTDRGDEDSSVYSKNVTLPTTGVLRMAYVIKKLHS